MLHTISPIDGRYGDKTSMLSAYFSESALMKYRCLVEIEYLIALIETGIIQGARLSDEDKSNLKNIVTSFKDEDASHIKQIESKINHDVKAIEYFIKEKLEKINLSSLREWVHFGLTSQDINNSAFPLMIRNAFREIVSPEIKTTRLAIYDFALATKDIPMLAFTHGQPASPTLLGKEMMVFVERLDIQLDQLEKIELSVKFSGATGNFNAHVAAYPDINWSEWADHFTSKYLNIGRYKYTTQIEHYDQIAALCHAAMRINTILIDLCRDVWMYISMNYLTQKVNPDEVGSSAMPHKVNPIDFENAEGNLGYANAIFGHLADKLPVSRLQRDLTDSTVLRNIGVPVAHTFLSLKSLQKGLSKISANETKTQSDLNDNWAVLAEAIQTILRREGVSNPYEQLKDLTRGKEKLTKENLHLFIQKLQVREEVKEELRKLTPGGYTGMRYNI
ncbi:MAG TPA: adenylosuccinate lyase [Saprospiraceae bacterium]|nr:adenylosuccinate lyase [Saprospiraceae bacterium]